MNPNPNMKPIASARYPFHGWFPYFRIYGLEARHSMVSGSPATSKKPRSGED